MGSVAAFPDGEWDSFNRMFCNEDQLDFTQQIDLHQFSLSLDHDEGLNFMNPSSFFPVFETNMSLDGVNDSLFYSSNALDSNYTHYNSQESSPSGNSSGSMLQIPPPNHETCYITASNIVAVTNEMTMPLDVSMDTGGVSESVSAALANISNGDTVKVTENLSTHHCLGKPDAVSHPAANLELANELLLKRKFDVLQLHAEGGNSSETTKKKPRVPKDASKVYKNVQSKKSRKINSNANEGQSNTGSDGQSSSTTCSSEDDNVSQDTNGVATSDSKASHALNLNGKTRASRGTATDPQSLYARKRRERINERLRILQNLVPNGTKVDISTMLEEAVHYVKFLQLQIKLLSSDDLWMYAPIAYNGIDIVLNKKISTLL